jgi:hypothetical protein
MMTKIELKQSLLIILSLAITSVAIWLFEMTKIIGWKGLEWLQVELFSPYAICCLAAGCFMTPMMLKYRKIDSKIILTFLTYALINIIAFFLAEVFFKGIYSRADFMGNKYGLYFLGFMIFIGFSIGYYIVTHYLIVNMPKLFAVVFATSEILMFILAIVTVYFVRGFGHYYNLIDAVKMGYPQFWICILLGLSGVFILTKNVNTAEE